MLQITQSGKSENKIGVISHVGVLRAKVEKNITCEIVPKMI